MMEPFEQALTMLNGQGADMHQEGWMPDVLSSLNGLVQSYQQLTHQNRAPIDYGAIPTQAAYLYAYAMPRAYFALEMLRRHRQAIGAPLFAAGAIEVVSFGGGPASELVGLLKYLSDPAHGEAVTAITYRVFDKDADWQNIAEQVVLATDTAVDVTMIYECLDLADAHMCAAVNVTTADLIIFSYIMSELCSLGAKDLIAQNVQTVLTPIKVGASILFIDSRHAQFIQYFQSCRQYIGTQKNDDGEDVNLPLPAFLPTFQIYYNAFERNPRMDAAIVSKWLVKA